jgi:heme A synthase
VGDILFTTHWAVRYLVLLAGLVAAALALARLRAGSITRPGRIAGAAFVGLLDLQAVIGVAMLLVRPFQPVFMGHVTMMALALVVAHGFAIALRRRPAERQTPAVQLTGVVLTLALIVGGILAIGRSVV